MRKRTLALLPVLVLFAVGLVSTQVLADDPPDLGGQVQALQAENEQLREKMGDLEEQVALVLDRQDGVDLDKIRHPERYYTFLDYDDSDTARSGFVRKGGLTGTMDKLMDINLFAGVRFNRINNDTGQGQSDVDQFDIPFARLLLTGQALTDVYYAVQYDFARMNEELREASVSWRPFFKDNPFLEDFAITAGLTQIFLSPAGMEEPWELDFIDYPLMVEHLLPPGEARDVGVFTKMDFMNQGRLKVWLGLWNGTHRMIPLTTSNTGVPINDLAAYDVYGNGQDNDGFATMARVQVNVLDEEDFFLMFSGGIERNKISYVEINSANGAVITHENKIDRILDAAAEFRFLERKTWVRGEFMHTYLADTRADTQRGYYVAAGSRLDFIHDSLAHLELVGRYDRVKVNDSMHTVDDRINRTVGLNFFFDPEHKHDAKLQLNYVFRKDSGPTNLADDMFLVQFVLGF